MAHIIDTTLKEMYETSSKKENEERRIFGGFIHPKCKHNFRLDVDSQSFSPDEKKIFASQVIEAFIQESFLQNNNLFTVVLEDEVTNKIIKLLDKLKQCNFIITYLSSGEPVAVSYITNCKLLFNRSNVSYAESAPHDFRLIYSFEKIVRTTV